MSKSETFEDPYAKKAHSFSNELTSQEKMHGLGSDIQKQKELEEANKPRTRTQRKLDRIFSGSIKLK